MHRVIYCHHTYGDQNSCTLSRTFSREILRRELDEFYSDTMMVLLRTISSKDVPMQSRDTLITGIITIRLKVAVEMLQYYLIIRDMADQKSDVCK